MPKVRETSHMTPNGNFKNVETEKNQIKAISRQANVG